MPIELKMLAWSVALGLVHVLLGAALITHQRGLRWNVGARDAVLPPLTGAAARVDRAHLDAAPAVARARHDQRAIDGDAALVLHRRDEPGGVGIPGMDGDREAELRRPQRGDLVPRRRPVGGAEDAVVVLAPQRVGRGGAAHDEVRILHQRIQAAVGRHVLGDHAARGDAPAGATFKVAEGDVSIQVTGSQTDAGMQVLIF